MLARCPVDSAHEKLIGTMREVSRRGSKQNYPASPHLDAPGGSCRSERRERPGMTDCENGVFIHLQHVLSNHLFFLVRDIMFEKV